MIRNAISVVSVRVAGILAAFAFLALVSRLLAPSELGAFLFATTTVTLLHFVGLCGANTEVVRIGVPMWRANRLRAFRRLTSTAFSLVTAGCMALIPGLVLIYYLWPQRSVVEITGASPGELAAIVVIALFLFSLRTLFADLVRAAGKYHHSMASLSLIPNVASILVVLAVWVGSGEVSALNVFGVWIAGLLVALLVLLLEIARDRPHQSEQDSVELHEPTVSSLFRNGLPIMLSQVSYQLVWHGGVWYVAYFFAGPDVAMYAICLRLAEVVALPGVIVPFLGQPIVASGMRIGEERKLSGAIQTLTTIALVPSATLLMFLLLFGGFILEVLFGPDYVGGAVLLVLVAGARSLDIFGGSAAQSVLLIRGNGRAVLSINVATLIVFAGLLPVLTPVYGLIGVGVALVTYYAVRSVALMAAAKILTRIATWPTLSAATVRSSLQFYRG